MVTKDKGGLKSEDDRKKFNSQQKLGIHKFFVVVRVPLYFLSSFYDDLHQQQDQPVNAGICQM